MSHIADHRLGKMLDKGKNKGKPYPYLRNTNVQWLEFNLDDIKEMRFEDDELDEYEVREGDLLVCEGGEPGRCAIWQGQTTRMMFQKPFIGSGHSLKLIRGLAIPIARGCTSGYLDHHPREQRSSTSRGRSSHVMSSRFPRYRNSGESCRRWMV